MLTEAGRVLQEYATRAFHVLAEAQEAIEGLRGLVRGRLRISAASTIGTYMLPEVLGAFKGPVSRDRGEPLHYQQGAGPAARALHAVGSRVRRPAPPLPGALGGRVPRGRIDAHRGPQHRLAHREGVVARELSDEVFILREKGSGTREIMEEELGRAGVPLRHAMELGSTEAIKQAVAVNLGVSIVSTHSFSQEVMLGRLCSVPIADLSLRRGIYLVYLASMLLSPAALGFRAFLLEACALSVSTSTSTSWRAGVDPEGDALDSAATAAFVASRLRLAHEGTNGESGESRTRLHLRHCGLCGDRSASGPELARAQGGSGSLRLPASSAWGQPHPVEGIRSGRNAVSAVRQDFR